MVTRRSIERLHFFLIVFCGLIFTTPILINGCVFAQDFRFHFNNSQYFSEQFWQGDFYPRWLQNMNFGFGSPTLFFYAPISYYFTSLFSPLFQDNLSVCRNELGLSSSLALIASGITAYFWLTEIVPRTPAVIASILYMAWPYHLSVDLYTRFAFAEYWSFVWIPLILYFSIKMVKGSSIYVIGLSIAIALLILTHLPTFVIFLPIIISYGLFLASQNRQRSAIFCLILGATIAIGLSAIYWLPAITTQDAVSMDAMSTSWLYYENRFLFSPSEFNDDFLGRYLEILTVLSMGLAFCLWKISGKYLELTSRYESNYWMMVTALSFFMMLPFSNFIWKELPLLQKIQFPWRFNTILTVAVIGIFALAISRLQIHRDSWKKIKNYSGSRAAIPGSIVLLLMLVQFPHLQQRIVLWGSRNTIVSLSSIAFLLFGVSLMKKPINFSKNKLLSIGSLLAIIIYLGGFFYAMRTSVHSYLLNTEIARKTRINLSAMEYRPRWVPREIFETRLSQLGKELPKIQIQEGQGSYFLRRWQPRKIVFQANTTIPTMFTLRQFYYPGWGANIKNSSRSLPVHVSEFGLLQISVPTGKHEISLTLNALREERIGQIISTVSLIFLLLLALFLKKDRSSTRPE